MIDTLSNTAVAVKVKLMGFLCIPMVLEVIDVRSGAANWCGSWRYCT
jgi:hypothetical protein